MNKQALALFLSLVSLQAGQALGGDAANVVIQTRELPSFTSIALNGISTVRIHKGPQEVRVAIDGNLIHQYETKVRNNELVMGFKCTLNPSVLRAYNSIKHCEVDITVPSLDGFKLTGLANVVVDSFDYKDLKLDVTGAGTIELSGSASTLRVNTCGAGKVFARNLASRMVKVKSTGAGTIEVAAVKELTAEVSGSGKITYWENPSVIQRITGSGSIRHAGN